MSNNNSEEKIIIQSTNKKAKIKLTIKGISILLFSFRPLKSVQYNETMSKRNNHIVVTNKRLYGFTDDTNYDFPLTSVTAVSLNDKGNIVLNSSTDDGLEVSYIDNSMEIFTKIRELVS